MVHLNVEMHNTRNSEDIVYSLWKHKVLRDIDKLYFIRREYKYRKQPNINNYDIWTDYYKTELGGKIKPYLEQAKKDADPFNEDKREGALYLGEYDYQYWGTALDMMAANNEDISEFPKTAEEAFSQFVGENLSTYAQIISNYDEDKTVLENRAESVNNLFFDFLQARLEDYDTFNERYTPGGFQMLKDAKPIMMAIRYGKPEELQALATAKDPEQALMALAEKYKDFSPDYDPTELSTIAHYQTYNALYDNCISISAVQNINQRLTALLLKLKLKVPVLFGSLVDNYDKVSVTERDKLGSDIKARMVNGIDTELLTTNFLASSVDAVKDALLEFFGIDDKNLNIACLMAKIGATPRDIGLLLNQPVIMEAMKIVKEGKGYKSLSNALEEALQELVGDNTKYEDLMSNFYGSLSANNNSNRNSLTNTAKLIRYIGMAASPNYAEDLDTFVKGQFAVVHLMKELQADAQELAEQVAVSQSTSIKSVKSNFGAILAVLQKVQRFASSFGGQNSAFEVALPSALHQIINPYLRFNQGNMEEVLGDLVDSPYCMEQIAFSAIMGFAEALGDYFPYLSEGFMVTGNGLAALTNRGYMSAEMIDIHNKAAMMFFLQNMTELFNESNHATLYDRKTNTLTDTGIPNRMFYTVYFPEKFVDILEVNEAAYKAGKTNIRYKDIPILGSIIPEVEKYTQGQSERRHILKMDGIGGLTGDQKDNLIESWESMFQSDDPMLVDLARHLFMYSYYNRGFDFGPTTFMSLVPLFIKTTLGEGEYANFFNRVFNLSLSPKGNALQELGGNVDNIVLKDYYKAFILNTRNLFYHFTKKLYAPRNTSKSAYTVAKTNMHEYSYDVVTGTVASESYKQKLREEIKNELLAAKEPFNNDDIENYVNSRIATTSYFTVSCDDKNDTLLLKQLSVPIKDALDPNKTVGYKFTPCVEIDGDVYICDSNLDSDANTKFNEVELGKTMTYYKMDVPVGTDYSTPTLYGTRAKMLADTGQEKLISIINDIIKSYMNSEDPNPSSTGDNSADIGNVFGIDSTTGALATNGDTMEALLLNLLSMKSALQQAIQRAKNGQFENSMELISSVIAALINFSKKNIYPVKGKGMTIKGKPRDTTVSEFIYGSNKSIGPWGTPSSTIGDTADAIGRDFFKGDILLRYPNMTKLDLANVISDLTKFREHLDRNFSGRDNYRVVSDDFYLAAKYIANTAGEGTAKTILGAVDLIIYDREGNLYLCDMKAKRSRLSSEDLENYSKLLSLYKKLLEAACPVLKGKIKELRLLKFNTYYEQPIEVREKDTEPGIYYTKNGPYKKLQLYANGVPIEQSSEASYKAPRLSENVKESYINVTESEFQELFEAIDDFEVVDITEDANKLIATIDNYLAKLPAQLGQMLPEALIELLDNLEFSIRDNFLIDSLPYLIGEEYRGERIRDMLNAVRLTVRNYKVESHNAAVSEDYKITPLSYILQLLDVMKMLLRSQQGILEVVQTISTIDGLLFTLLGLKSSAITIDNKDSVEAALDNIHKILSLPDTLEVLEAIGYTEDIIDNQFNVAKTILNTQLSGNLELQLEDGEKVYKESNDGKPLCDL